MEKASTAFICTSLPIKSRIVYMKTRKSQHLSIIRLTPCTKCHLLKLLLPTLLVSSFSRRRNWNKYGQYCLEFVIHELKKKTSETKKVDYNDIETVLLFLSYSFIWTRKYFITRNSSNIEENDIPLNHENGNAVGW